jgi:hypothetical protein
MDAAEVLDIIEVGKEGQDDEVEDDQAWLEDEAKEPPLDCAKDCEEEIRGWLAPPLLGPHEPLGKVRAHR